MFSFFSRAKREQRNLELYRQMRSDDIDAGRESEVGQNTYRAIQGLPLLDPAGASDGSLLAWMAALAAVSLGTAWLVWWLSGVSAF